MIQVIVFCIVMLYGDVGYLCFGGPYSLCFTMKERARTYEMLISHHTTTWCHNTDAMT